MTLHEIELPPLPTPDADHYDNGTFAPVWKQGKMEAYARAAIEADRCPTDTQQKLNEVLEYLQNETMKLEAAYGSNFKKEATDKARAATEKMKEAVYAIKNIDRQHRGEPVKVTEIPLTGNAKN